jgi:dehydrogenase/reductase SDR family member 1
LDILVNNALGQPESQGASIGVPFWELPIGLWDQLHAVGLRSHYVASVFAARMMVAQRSGLIVNVSSRGASTYLFNIPYGVGKAGVDRLTADTAHELRPHGVAVVSIWPGLTRTEIVMAEAERWPLERSRSPHFSGRAIAALASDPEILEKTGRALPVAELAEEYGFTDPEDA